MHSDFLLCGPGIWWKDDGDSIEFFDGPVEVDFKEQGPSLQHFRSSNMKKCIDSKVSMPITTLRIYNNSGDQASYLISNEASATSTL